MQAFIANVTTGNVDFSKELYLKIYLSGCDYKCKGCNTPYLLETKFEQETDLLEVVKEMRNNIGMVEGIFFTGGEPCFQKAALLYLAKKAKEIKLKTVLDTNGSKPEVIEALLKDRLIDLVVMDLKAPFNELFEKVTRSSTWFVPSEEIMKQVKETLQALKAYDEETEIIFRTLILPGLVFRKEDLEKIGKEIERINCSWELKPYSNSEVKEKEMERVERPTDQFMKNLREHLEKKFPNIIVRNAS